MAEVVMPPERLAYLARRCFLHAKRFYPYDEASIGRATSLDEGEMPIGRYQFNEADSALLTTKGVRMRGRAAESVLYYDLMSDVHVDGSRDIKHRQDLADTLTILTFDGRCTAAKSVKNDDGTNDVWLLHRFLRRILSERSRPH